MTQQPKPSDMPPQQIPSPTKCHANPNDPNPIPPWRFKTAAFHCDTTTTYFQTTRTHLRFCLWILNGIPLQNPPGETLKQGIKDSRRLIVAVLDSFELWIFTFEFVSNFGFRVSNFHIPMAFTPDPSFAVQWRPARSFPTEKLVVSVAMMKSPRAIIGPWILGLAVALTAGCSSSATAPHAQAPAGASPFTQVEQQAITPDQALARLVEGNKRFVAGQGLHRSPIQDAKASAAGQYPFATVLCCIDSRSVPEIVFDQGIGDLFVARVAGNYAPTDVLGSMEFAAKVAGSKLIVVMGHTECGAVKGACDNVKLGNLTTVVQAIRPAVDEVEGFSGERTSKNAPFVYAVTEENVRRTISHIRHDSPVLRDMEKSGQIKIVGAMQNLATGEVTFLR
jgi:carbonic anhydrase